MYLGIPTYKCRYNYFLSLQEPNEFSFESLKLNYVKNCYYAAKAKVWTTTSTCLS